MIYVFEAGGFTVVCPDRGRSPYISVEKQGHSFLSFIYGVHCNPPSASEKGDYFIDFLIFGEPTSVSVSKEQYFHILKSLKGLDAY